MPLFSFTDVAALAAQHHQGDRAAAIQALLQSGPSVNYAAHRAYADVKLIIVWWVAALARHLPSGMAVYAVSPGSAPDTQASRNGGLAIKWVMLPVLKLIPGMSQTPETAARRYLQAYEFGTDVSGLFYASPPKRVTGPIEAMQHPHLHNYDNQEAAWKAIVKVSEILDGFSDIARDQKRPFEELCHPCHGKVLAVMSKSFLWSVADFYIWPTKDDLYWQGQLDLEQKKCGGSNSTTVTSESPEELWHKKDCSVIKPGYWYCVEVNDGYSRKEDLLKVTGTQDVEPQPTEDKEHLPTQGSLEDTKQAILRKHVYA
ncbi:hypothetical protein FANTH_14432 [Fusarium anthophilum]|uniref:Uncharacterized protein n=1 Tax=Fusarium anthophilum TaxID=48485 RepID=A0A8H4YIV2_9HYPO|nr:hypothetical protein FANTH_14432 [Fusarium anthophilum]